MTTSTATNQTVPRQLLIALSVTLGMQVIRAFFTLTVYHFGERYGFNAATIPALVVFSHAAAGAPIHGASCAFFDGWRAGACPSRAASVPLG